MNEAPETLREKGTEGDVPQVVPPVNEQPVEPPNEPQNPESPAPVVPAKPDYEALYKASSSESLIQRERARVAEEQLKGLTNKPTESELQAAFPEWDLMSEAEKSANRTALEAKRISQSIQLKLDAEDARKSRSSAIEVTIASHPELEGKEQAFKDFCEKPTHKTVDLEILVGAFLHQASSPPSPTTPSRGLEPGNGGPRLPDKPKKILLEDAAQIRKTDYRRYMELVKTGAIEEL